MKSIAIIGSGLAGITAAYHLRDKANVTLFEKSRGVGGRLATRYADPYQFDHGAQFFTVRTEAFKEFIAPLIEQKIITPWMARFVEITGVTITSQRQWDDSPIHYVGTPRMNAVCKTLAKPLNVALSTRVDGIQKAGDKWQLTGEEAQTLGEFDWVISSAPAAQTEMLLPKEFAAMERIKATKMKGCYALMLGFEQPLELPWDAALVKQADISWMSVNSSKPARQTGFSLQVLATNDWAEAHMEDDDTAVTSHLLQEVAKVIGQPVDHAKHTVLHRWRYANIAKQSGEAALVDVDNQLAACGDWCIQGRVESAFTSATFAAYRILQTL